MKTIVVAHYNEDLSWLAKLPIEIMPCVISKGDKSIETDVSLDNVGREPHSYLWYISQMYDTLEGTYIFTQGWPFDHCRDFLDKVGYEVKWFQWLGDNKHTSKPNGNPADHNLNLHALHRIWSDAVESEYEFYAGSIFAVTADKIKEHPKEVYEQLLEAVTKDRQAWAMERLWGCLWS